VISYHEAVLSVNRGGGSGLRTPRRTTHALVVEELRAMILGGVLQPGERLRIDDLARQLEVSPMPVREALHQLAAEGTITLDPYRGFSIAQLTAEEAEDLYSTRAPLEALAAEIAVPRLEEATLDALREAVAQQAQARDAGDPTAFIHADLAFHGALYAAAGRPVLARTIRGLINSSVRYSRANLPIPGSMDAALEAHRAILGACERRDAARAGEVTRRHTEQAAARVMRSLSRLREPPAVR
jgi:DNA-binding GntR family transcriptional regulator